MPRSALRQQGSVVALVNGLVFDCDGGSWSWRRLSVTLVHRSQLWPLKREFFQHFVLVKMSWMVASSLCDHTRPSSLPSVSSACSRASVAPNKEAEKELLSLMLQRKSLHASDLDLNLVCCRVWAPAMSGRYWTQCCLLFLASSPPPPPPFWCDAEGIYAEVSLPRHLTLVPFQPLSYCLCCPWAEKSSNLHHSPCRLPRHHMPLPLFSQGPPFSWSSLWMTIFVRTRRISEGATACPNLRLFFPLVFCFFYWLPRPLSLVLLEEDFHSLLWHHPLHLYFWRKCQSPWRNRQSLQAPSLHQILWTDVHHAAGKKRDWCTKIPILTESLTTLTVQDNNSPDHQTQLLWWCFW